MGGRNDAVKMLTPKKATYKFNANPIKIPIFFFTEMGKKHSYNLYGNLKDAEEKHFYNLYGKSTKKV